MFASNSPRLYSFPLLINLCELSSDNKRWGRGILFSQAWPGSASELIALIEWEGLPSSPFRPFPALFGEE